MSKKQPKRKAREGLDNYGRNEMHYAASESDISRLSELLKSGVESNLQDDDGWTPLHFAAQSQSPPVIKALLSSGASVDIPDNNGNTPLWRAVFSFRGDFGSIELLLAAGANAWKENKNGISAFELGTDTNNLALEEFFLGLNRV